MMVFPPANAIYRRETYDNYPAARAILQVVYEGLQLPMDQALRVESRWFAKILRSPEAAAMIRSLFVSMQELNKGARRPAAVPAQAGEEDRRARRRLHGRRHRLCQRAGRHRRRADRPRSGNRRQGQGAFAEADDRSGQQRPRHVRRSRRAARAHHRDARLCGAARLRSHHRGGVRGPQGQGRGDRQGAGCDRQRHHLRLQHLDVADHVARADVQRHAALHRHPLLLAGRAHDAGRDHHGQRDRRCGARDGARLRARHPQDPDRSQRFARLLYVARGRHLYSRGPFDAHRRGAGGDDRERRTHGRHAGGSAVAQRRGRRRSCLEDPESDRGRPR